MPGCISAVCVRTPLAPQAGRLAFGPLSERAAPEEQRYCTDSGPNRFDQKLKWTLVAIGSGGQWDRIGAQESVRFAIKAEGDPMSRASRRAFLRWFGVGTVGLVAGCDVASSRSFPSYRGRALPSLEAQYATWLNGQAADWDQLRGKVVFITFSFLQ